MAPIPKMTVLKIMEKCSELSVFFAVIEWFYRFCVEIGINVYSLYDMFVCMPLPVPDVKVKLGVTHTTAVILNFQFHRNESKRWTYTCWHRIIDKKQRSKKLDYGSDPDIQICRSCPRLSRLLLANACAIMTSIILSRIIISSISADNSQWCRTLAHCLNVAAGTEFAVCQSVSDHKLRSDRGLCGSGSVEKLSSVTVNGFTFTYLCSSNDSSGRKYTDAYTYCIKCTDRLSNWRRNSALA